jgi:hypothetical protein
MSSFASGIVPTVLVSRPPRGGHMECGRRVLNKKPANSLATLPKHTKCDNSLITGTSEDRILSTCGDCQLSSGLWKSGRPQSFIAVAVQQMNRLIDDTCMS